MSLRITFPVLILLSLLVTGCSSQSELANTSTEQMGAWSPVGSRQVSRQTRFILASRYQLAVGTIEHPADNVASHDSEFAQSLAQQLRQHRLSVAGVSSFESLTAALSSARESGADILLLAQVQRWPDKKTQPCPSEGDDSSNPENCKAQEPKSDMSLGVALYDVREGRMLDSISARSQRGLSVRVYDNPAAELEQLCKMIAGQLSAY